MELYQLSATGESIHGWQFKTNSKQVYVSVKQAEAAIPSFIDKCCDDVFFDVAVRETIKVKLIPLELSIPTIPVIFRIALGVDSKGVTNDESVCHSEKN